MLNPRIENELNKQLNKEFFSAYLYMAMSAHFQSVNLLGFANWMNIQAQEELMHAQKFYNYILERNGKVVLELIEKPKTDWDSNLAAFEDALAHEEMVTSSINNIASIAIEEKDHATNIFLQWFITEQIEEESSAMQVINNLKLIKDHPGGIFMLDKDLGQRQLNPVPMQ